MNRREKSQEPGIHAIVPDGFVIYGMIYHSEVDIHGYLTHWKVDSCTGKATRKYRRYVGHIWR